MSVHLDHALRYAARGWPVFPLAPGTKRPATAHGFHDATTDIDQITNWWTSNPTAGIGMPTGIAFDVLDVDHDDEDIGVGDLPDCETDGGPVVVTGSGKVHLYFRPTGIGRRIRFSKWCDWLGTGGYVIAPPSLHPDTGRPYRWQTDDGLALTDPPAPLVEMLDPKPAPRPERIQITGPARFSDAGKWNANGLIGRVVSAPEGERNHALNWAAHRVGMDLHDGKASASDATDALGQLARVAELAGLTTVEVDRTIESGFSQGRAGIVNKRRGAA